MGCEIQVYFSDIWGALRILDPPMEGLNLYGRGRVFKITSFEGSMIFRGESFLGSWAAKLEVVFFSEKKRWCWLTWS